MFCADGGVLELSVKSPEPSLFTSHNNLKARVLSQKGVVVHLVVRFHGIWRCFLSTCPGAKTWVTTSADVLPHPGIKLRACRCSTQHLGEQHLHWL